MPIYTKNAAQVFDPVDANSSPRGADMGETQIWGTEVERAIADFGVLTTLGRTRRVTAAGDMTIGAATDDRVYVAKTVPEATNVNLPSVADRIAAGGAPIFLKNEQANPAQYPLQPVLSGTDTLDGSTSPLPLDTEDGQWWWPIAGTPNNWETR
jgi:hypothetical protein